MRSAIFRRLALVFLASQLFFFSHMPMAGAQASSETSAVEALRALDQGDYARAVQSYEALTKTGIANGHLYYNLGIAYFRSGRVGDAMASFLAARRLLPRDPDVAANLRFTSEQLKDRLPYERAHSGTNAALAWTKMFTVREYAFAASVSAALVGLLLLFGALKKNRALRLSASVALVVPAFVAAVAVHAEHADERWGAVTSPKLAVHSAPGDKTTVIFELSQGAPVIDKGDSAEGYRLIELADGRQGWASEPMLRVFR